MDLKCDSPGRLLIENGFFAFYAYETARDLLLRREPSVVKILTDADLLQISKLFPGAVHGDNGGVRVPCDDTDIPVRFHVTDFPMERVVRIPGFLEYKQQVLLSAAPSALFTANCFFYDVEKGIFHDPLDQYTMLKRGVFGSVEHPERAFKRCPTLPLKAARVVGETGFLIEDSLREFMKNSDVFGPYGSLNDGIIEDFFAICLSKRAFEAFSLLDEWGVLERIMPELTALKEVAQDKDHHPEGNGFRHTMRCLKCVKKPNKNLIIALLLHDIGKAVTGNSARKNRNFPNHSMAGTTIAKAVLARFRFDAEDADEVLFLVQNHMILDAVKRLPKNRLRHVFSSPYISNLLELYRADLESCYHRVDGYYLAARTYKEFLRTERFNRQGVYA